MEEEKDLTDSQVSLYCHQYFNKKIEDRHMDPFASRETRQIFRIGGSDIEKPYLNFSKNMEREKEVAPVSKLKSLIQKKNSNEVEEILS